MHRFLKIVVEIILGLAAAGCIYGIVSSIATGCTASDYEQQEYGNSGTYQSPYSPSQDKQQTSGMNEKRARKVPKKNSKNYSHRVGVVLSSGYSIDEWEYEGHKYIMAHEYGIVHSASCPCGWIERL